MRNLVMLLAVSFSPLASAEESSQPTPIVPADAVVETVATGYTFTEGPALGPDGSIYFSDVPKLSILRYDPSTGQTSLYTDQSGGTNGMMFHGRWLIACEDLKSRSVTLRPVDDGHPGFTHSLTLADRFEGKRFNGPNDVVFAHETGLIYFTDPLYGNKQAELDIEGVYVILPGLDEQGASGPSVVRIIDDLVRPNGIGLSPDEQTLYVADNADQKVYAFDVVSPERVGNRRVLHETFDLGGPDGMAVDAKGRLYVAIFGKGILVLSPGGDRLGFIEAGPQTTNCVFGQDGKTLYITAEKSLKRITLNTDSTQGLDADGE